MHHLGMYRIGRSSERENTLAFRGAAYFCFSGRVYTELRSHGLTEHLLELKISVLVGFRNHPEGFITNRNRNPSPLVHQVSNPVAD